MALERADRKKGNPIKEYFKNFGLKQIADFIMIAGAIVMIVGLAVDSIMLDLNVVALVGACVVIVGVGIAGYLVGKVLLSKINKRAPAYRRAFINMFILIAMLALAIVAVIFTVNPV